MMINHHLIMIPVLCSPCLVWTYVISCFFTPCFVVLCSFYLANHSESCNNRTELYGQLNPNVHQKLDNITAYLNIYFSSLEFFIIQALHFPFKGLKSEVFLCPNWTLGSTEPRCALKTLLWKQKCYILAPT